MAKAPASTSVAVVKEDRNQLPAFLQGVSNSGQVGNLDSSDLIIPRIKLLQAISPEVTEKEDAQAGQFWHSLAEIPLGEGLAIIPITMRKSYTLWAPRGDNRGVLARANDGINWDVKEEFRVKLKGVKNEVTWSTMEGTVAGSGLDRFGSSNPDDNNSTPAATLTYNILCWLPDFPELSPSVVLNARSAVQSAKQLYNKIKMRPVPLFGQVYNMTTKQEQGAEGPYFTYNYTADGYVQDQDLYKKLEAMHDDFEKKAWRANEEDETGVDAEAKATGTVGGKGGKF